MSKSKIEWCDRTWNPVTGCTPISAGCQNCYAKRMAERFAGPWGLDPANPFAVTMHPERLDEPLRWKKQSMVFVCSMSDLFHDDVPDKFISEVFNTMARCCPRKFIAGAFHEAKWVDHPRQTFLVLTKRPDRMKKFVINYLAEKKEYADKFKLCPTIEMQNSPAAQAARDDAERLPSNIWLGVTAENQEQADKRIPVLLSIPAAKRFVSVEPMIGPVDLRHIHYDGMVEIDALTGDHGVYRPLAGRSDAKLDWVICGGESGPGARPMHPDWARSLRNQCEAAGTPFMFKQWGEWAPTENVVIDRDYPSQFMGTLPCCRMVRVGKKAAGRLLDGQEWLQYPDK